MCDDELIFILTTFIAILNSLSPGLILLMNLFMQLLFGVFDISEINLVICERDKDKTDKKKSKFEMLLPSAIQDRHTEQPCLALWNRNWRTIKELEAPVGDRMDRSW